LGYPDLSNQWSSIASTLKPNLEKFWDPSPGLYIDNLNNPSLHPQDGNSLVCWFSIATPSRTQLITTNLKKRWGNFGPMNPECSGPVSPFISGFELQALIHANKINDALSMIRTTWGWMINNPLSTGSTMLEAWGGDGSLTYPFYKDKPSYISHCHPFSTGPVLVLTFEVLGLRFTGVGGKEWEFRPCLGDLEHCQGGFTGVYGKYSAGWRKTRENGRVGFESWVDTPEGTTGRVRLPTFGTSETGDGEGYRWLDGISGGKRCEFAS
jgi:Bacterial alpha-L-rhamnosidase C-terminal domain